MRAGGLPFGGLVARADAALYSAKRQDQNCLAIAESEVALTAVKVYQRSSVYCLQFRANAEFLTGPAILTLTCVTDRHSGYT